jgi:hypothetical protein
MERQAEMSNYFESKSDDAQYGGAKDIVDAEIKHIEEWRGRSPQLGIALSGGGIRSASFCLGVLQALANQRVLQKFDYLSTVSGGGYIGASLTYLLHESARDTHAHRRDPTRKIDVSISTVVDDEGILASSLSYVSHGSTGDVGAQEADAMPKFDVSRERFPYLSYPMVSAPLPIEDESSREKGRLLRRLRQNASYLAPGSGITFLSLAGVFVRNLGASSLVHVVWLVILIQALITIGLFPAITPFNNPSVSSTDWGSLFKSGKGLLLFSGVMFCCYLVLSALYVFLTGFFDGIDKYVEKVSAKNPTHPAEYSGSGSYRLRRAYERLTNCLLKIVIALLFVGGLPWVYDLMVHYELARPDTWLALLSPNRENKSLVFGAIATAVGILGNVWGFLQSRSTSKPKIPTSLVITVASLCLLFGVLLLVYHFTEYLNVLTSALTGSTSRGTQFAWITGGALVILGVFGWWPDANYVSLHRYYRDRLMELFLPDLKAIQKSIEDDTDSGIEASRPGNSALLGDHCGVAEKKAGILANSTPQGLRSELLPGPYHLINANVVLVSSQHPRYRGRGGDNYILSPLFCGSRATGWKETDVTPGAGLTLATAMAISGAALSPNAAPGGEGATRQPVLSVLMGLLNIRLGYWCRNPNSNSRPKPGLWSWVLRTFSREETPNMISPGLFESFGRLNLEEHQPYVLLTDGGHFENLGLYELVRRRLKLIILCDATADPDFKFVDLANAIEKVRADFGAIVEITSEHLLDLVPMRSKAAADDHAALQFAKRGYLIAEIKYSQLDDQLANGVPASGLLIYLKATFFKELFADMHGYRRAHTDFPNQSTGDQFFDEKQFESYRELGFRTTWLMLDEICNSTEPKSTLMQRAATLLQN